MKRRMNKIALFTLLVICGSVFADECTTLNTQATCTGNTNCNYTATGGKCDNKCTGLAKTDCENPTNSPNCDSNTEKCDIPLTCNTFKDKQADCSGNNACTWVDAVVGTCDFMNKATTVTTCDGKKTDKATCEANGMCSFTAATFQSCDFKVGQCSSNLTSATCDSKFCTKIDTVCGIKYTINCEGQPDLNSCSPLSDYCSFSDNKCVSYCSLLKDDASCIANDSCEVKTHFSCVDAQAVGQAECQKTNTDDTCISSFCSKTQSPATCQVVNTYCSAKTATDCSNDTENCQLKGASPSECNNKVTAGDCNPLNSKTSCEAKAGCSWSAYSCSNKTEKSCLVTDKEADCSAAAKFCTYTSTGTCEAKSNSFILSAVGSLLATLLFL